MEVEYDLSKNYFKHYNEAQGIIIDKVKILKHPERRIKTYTGKSTLLIIETLLLVMITYFLYKMNNQFSTLQLISSVIVIIVVVFLSLYFLNFFVNYTIEKKRGSIGKLVFTEEGVQDQSIRGIEVNIKWNKIKGVVLDKNTITFITDDLIFFFVNMELKNEILKAIKKYNRNLLIIDKTIGKE